MNLLRTFAFSAVAALAVAASPSFAEDAMATDAMATDAMATDAMAPAMTPLTDDEFKRCSEQARSITFPAAQHAATMACHGLHQGMDVMTAIDRVMATDSMAPTDAMAPATK